MPDIFGNSIDSPAVTKDPLWKGSLKKAMRESDGVKLVELIHATELALFGRWQESDTAGQSKERDAMNEAVESLRSLTVNRLGWPSWT